ncbi:unnamed protein product [Lepidochelys olivacea]
MKLRLVPGRGSGVSLFQSGGMRLRLVPGLGRGMSLRSVPGWGEGNLYREGEPAACSWAGGSVLCWGAAVCGRRNKSVCVCVCVFRKADVDLWPLGALKTVSLCGVVFVLCGTTGDPILLASYPHSPPLA